MCISLVMLTDGSVDTITCNNVIGFILTIVVLIMTIIINSNDKRD